MPGKPNNGFDANGNCPAFTTAFGDISTDPGGFISAVFGVLLAVSGAIALLLIARAGYRIMTSEGKPEAVKEGRDQLIAAIVGLMLLIFSLVFLELIGVDILKIPCLGNNPCSTANGTPNQSISMLGCVKTLYTPGSSGQCVTYIQKALNLDPADGNYDQRTQEAVKKYQQDQGIYSDGDVGPCTWGKLLNLSVNPICNGPLDSSNLTKFQTDNGLEITGSFNDCTWNALIGQAISDSCKRK
jgi:hypothetical protein